MPSTEDIAPIILADLNPDREDSDYGSCFESDTTSLISAAKNYIFENGLRYHGYKENPQRILDIGTGSGIWAMDMADQYPSAEVIGVDLSPIQPNLVPPNLKFEVDDIEDEWTYQPGTFDMVFIRDMAGFVYDWSKLFRQALRALKPGGWVEVQNLFAGFLSDDGTLPPDAILQEWCNYIGKATNESGREGLTSSKGKALEEAGFVSVGVRVKKYPIGQWPKEKLQKEIGMYFRQMLIDGCEGITLALFARVLGWEREKIDEFVKELRADLMNPKFHSYAKLYTNWGRKPL
ncbi:hypothetical protein RUND412_002567 [Rhizina undulata]